jgi:hypothetical protein
MAIALEFIDFIIPIAAIKAKYPGGWDQCLKDHENLIGGRVWYDEHLFRDGAMNSMDIGNLVTAWRSLGFETHLEENGVPTEWLDVCVFESMMGEPTLKCGWLEYDPTNNTAYLKDTLPSRVCGRAG